MNRSLTIYTQRQHKLEKAYTPKLIRAIKDFRNNFISDLRAYGKNTAIGNLQQIAIDEKLTTLLQSIYKTAGLAGARLQHSELLRAEQKAASFGRNERWVADIIEFLRMHMVNFVQDITDTMRADIVKILEKGVDEGWGIDEIVAQLRQLNRIEARARVIARTETVRAMNVGHAVAAKDTPYEVDKKWNAARDHRTRHSHAKINGHIVDENGYFKVSKQKGGHDEMLYPGDANASPENTVNCRCRVTYIPKRDAAGRLVMRRPNQATIVPMRRPQRIEPAQIAAILKDNIRIGVSEK